MFICVISRHKERNEIKLEVKVKLALELNKLFLCERANRISLLLLAKLVTTFYVSWHVYVDLTNTSLQVTQCSGWQDNLLLSVKNGMTQAVADCLDDTNNTNKCERYVLFCIVAKKVSK